MLSLETTDLRGEQREDCSETGEEGSEEMFDQKVSSSPPKFRGGS